MKFARIVNHLWTDVENERKVMCEKADREDVLEIYDRIYTLLDEMELYRLSTHEECVRMRNCLDQDDFEGFWRIYNAAMEKYKERKVYG